MDGRSHFETIEFPVEGMSCAGCVGRLERGLAANPSVSEASVNLVTHTAHVKYDASNPLSDILQSAKDAGYPARTVEKTIRIEGATCASCVGRIETALKDVPGVISASFNLVTAEATISTIAGVDDQQLAAAISSAGYTPILSDQVEQTADQGKGFEKEWRNFLVAALFTLPVFATDMGGHVIPSFHHWLHQTIGAFPLGVAQFLLTTFVLIFPGRAFFTKGIPALLRGHADMNSLVAVGAGAAWVYSTIALFAPGLFPAGAAQLYFESAAVIVTLILLGRLLEARAKARAETALQELMSLLPDTAWLETKDGVVEVPASSLKLGDIVQIKPGAQVVADGVVREGSSYVDESMLTGESVPQAKEVGDNVSGGTINANGFMRIEVTAIGQDTMLSGIIKIVQSAQADKLPVQEMVDRVTLWFVPAVMAIAALTLAIWLVIGPAPALSNGLVAAVSVLIIACPCAMGLATPTSILVGTGRAANLGILFRKGSTLQTLQEAKVVAFDKTGTLTLGQFAVTGQKVFGNPALAKVAALQANSEHPIATAMAAVLPAPKGKVADFQALSGRGVRGEVDGTVVLIGNRKHMLDNGVEFAEEADAPSGVTRVYAAIDTRPAGYFDLSDQIRAEAKTAISKLRELGLRTVMLSGDAQTSVDAVAAELGIDTALGSLLPAEKLEHIRDLQQKAGQVVFVGDGINDAPALAAADAGVAMGAGTDVAKSTADVVLMANNVQNLPKAFRLSAQTLRNIKQNLFWAFGYNVLLIPVAAGLLYPAFGLLLSPSLAAGAMALSSVLVVSNALRLRWFQ